MQFYPFITNRLNVIERTGAARMASELQSLERATENFLRSCNARVSSWRAQKSTPFSAASSRIFNPRLKIDKGFSKSKVAVCAQ